MTMKIEIDLEKNGWNSSVKINGRSVRCSHFDLHIDPLSKPKLSIGVRKPLDWKNGIIQEGSLGLQLLDPGEPTIELEFDEIEDEMKGTVEKA